MELFRETSRNIRIIRNLVETGELDEEKYPLDIFRNEQGFIIDLLKDLEECSEYNNSY